MRITILGLGTQGDIRPAVAVGVALGQAGHRVRLCAPSEFATLAAEYQLDFAAMEVEYKPIPAFTPAGIAGRLARAGRQVAQAVRDRLFVSDKRPLEKIMNSSWHACHDAELILSGIGCFWADSIAEKQQVPLGWMSLQPFALTHNYPELITFSIPFLGGILNRQLQTLLRTQIWHAAKRGTNHWRATMLNLPPLSGSIPFPRVSRERQPIFYGFSPSVFPLPADWPEQYHSTGYWFLDRREDWTPPDSVVNFLQAGSPPVAIGFSSQRHMQHSPEAITQLIVEVTERTKLRIILLTGAGSLAELPHVHERLLVTSWLPHEWLFPRISAMVHHGGAGTTASALRAGIPSVFIPSHYEQAIWSRRLHRLGAAPPPLSLKRLTAEQLGAAIQQAVSDEQIKARVQALSQEIRRESGLERVVQLVEQYSGKA